MPEYYSSGIWDGNTKIMIDFEELPLITKELHEEFNQWIDYYNGYSPWIEEEKNKFDLKKLNEIGIKLAKQVKKIYPNIIVEYRGEGPTYKISNTIIS